MSAAMAPARPAWTRRTEGSSVLFFIFLSGGLWLACLLAWEVRQPELVVGLLASGAFVPLLGLAVRSRTRPIWVLSLRDEGDRVVDRLRETLKDRLPTSVTPQNAGHRGLLVGCEAVLRIDDPSCFVGVRRRPGDRETTVLLLAESRDRPAFDRLRRSIEAGVAPG